MWKFARILAFEILIPVLFVAAGALAGNVLVGLAVAIAIPLGIELAIHFCGKRHA